MGAKPMRDRSALTSPAPPVTAEAAHALIDQWVAPLVEIETVATRAALGRVAAADIRARAPVPNHTNSALDGYAVRAADLHRPAPQAAARLQFKIIGESRAGKPFRGAIGGGDAVRILTGAVMPRGADYVIAQEHCTREGDQFAVTVDAIKNGQFAGANVRSAGEDLAKGAIAIAAGRRLAPAHLGLAAALGLAELPVIRRPRIAFFSNGDELRAVGEPLKTGELYDSNRYTLYGMLADLGVCITDLGVVRDSPQAVQTALSEAARGNDMVITSAGASVGDADYIRQTIARQGRVGFWQVAIKPGKPVAFGKLNCGKSASDNADGALFFALPGNPVSVMVTFAIFVKPAIRRLAGEAATAPMKLHATAESPLRKRRGRAEYQRGLLSADAAGLRVRTTGEQGSGILSSMGCANCFIILPTDSAGVAAGETVEVLPFAGVWR